MSRPGLDHPRELLPWLASETLDGAERQEVEEHLRSCVACRRELEELRRLQEEVHAAAPRPPEGGLERLLEAVEREGAPSARQSRFRPWRALAAAVLVAAVGVALWWPASRPESPVGARGGGEEEVLRSLLVAGEVQPREELVLRWETAPGWREARFDLTVTTHELAPIARARGLETTSYRVPPEALADLPSGARLLWRLEAVRADGARHAEVFSLTLE